MLAEEDVTGLIMEAHRLLEPGGYLCVASLTHGETFVSRAIEFVWHGVHTLSPAIVGGCLPINLQPFLEQGKWETLHNTTVVSFGVASEVAIAKKV